MNLQQIVDALFADAEAALSTHPIMVYLLQLANAFIDQYLSANPNGGAKTQSAVAKK